MKKFILFLTAVAVGVGIALLLSPQSGQKNRKALVLFLRKLGLYLGAKKDTTESYINSWKLSEGIEETIKKLNGNQRSGIFTENKGE